MLSTCTALPFPAALHPADTLEVRASDGAADAARRLRERELPPLLLLRQPLLRLLEFLLLLLGLGTERQCSPRHRPHCEPSFLKLTVILWS